MFSRIALIATLALTPVGAGGVPTDVPASTARPVKHLAPTTHPSASHFTEGRVDNRWFPLRPGNRLVYEGSEDGDRLRDVFDVAYRTRVVDGVRCRVVRDRVFRNGFLDERTTDWYAQTKGGTVWYFGERTALLDHDGHVVSREGSFQSGRDGAEAGIFMPAHPAVGQTFQQEDYPGHAEDVFTVRDVHADVSVPVLATDAALATRETTPLEPGVLDHKFYVRDIGTVREVTVSGGNESLELVEVKHRHR
jgi:hypothetical protein